MQSIEPDGTFHFQAAAGDRAVARDNLVRWGSPGEFTDGRIIILADGSQLMAVEWAVRPDEEPLNMRDESLSFVPSSLDAVTLPRASVRGIVLEVPADLPDRDRLIDQVQTHSAKEDAVLLAGGDRLTGRIDSIDGQAIALETSLGRIQVPPANAIAVLLGTPLATPADAPDGHTLVGLADGSLLSVRDFDRDGDNLLLTLSSGAVLRGAEAGEIASLQPLGGKVKYLSDLEPHRYLHVPYLSLQWPLARDRSVAGGRLRAGGRPFVKGLGTHSAARLVYRLDGSHDRFAALAAVDDSAGRGGSVVFRVLLADDVGWNEVFTSPTLRGGDEPVPVSVPLENAKGLALVVDYADRGDELDHADWLDARLE